MTSNDNLNKPKYVRYRGGEAYCYPFNSSHFNITLPMLAFAVHFFKSSVLNVPLAGATSHWENVQFIEILWKDPYPVSPQRNYVKAI